uniref:Uncharacterized protein n=1 Tax=Timema cristinae TaxID=61476 RepID=A0A7R9D636_TIMCR|nr:unnamed protein product [Timema cristinae]
MSFARAFLLAFRGNSGCCGSAVPLRVPPLVGSLPAHRLILDSRGWASRNLISSEGCGRSVGLADKVRREAQTKPISLLEQGLPKKSTKIAIYIIKHNDLICFRVAVEIGPLQGVCLGSSSVVSVLHIKSGNIVKNVGRHEYQLPRILGDNIQFNFFESSNFQCSIQLAELVIHSILMTSHTSRTDMATPLVLLSRRMLGNLRGAVY